VNVLRKMMVAVNPGGLVLDLQVIRPDPVVEAGEERICEIWGEPLFRKADAATAAVEAAIGAGRLLEEAMDDHDVRTHYPGGAALVGDFAGKKRRIPSEAVSQLLAAGPVIVRERCRVRRLRLMPSARNDV
jgi:hypothetical protein